MARRAATVVVFGAAYREYVSRRYDAERMAYHAALDRYNATEGQNDKRHALRDLGCAYTSYKRARRRAQCLLIVRKEHDG